MPALDSSWLKHEWSQRHLNLLYNEFSVFYRNEDKPSGSYDDSDSGTKLTHKPFEVPSLHEWSLILGDAIHNMRSALDHIEYALALKHLSTQKSGRLPDRRTSFPLLPVPNSGQFAN